MTSKLVKSLLVVGSFTALAVSSHASITFDFSNGNGAFSAAAGVNEVNVDDPSLEAGSVENSGVITGGNSFSVTETGSHITGITLTSAENLGVAYGTLSLTAYINGTLFYTGSATNSDSSGNTITFMTPDSHSVTGLSLGNGTYTVSYAYSYTGYADNISYAAADTFHVQVFESGQHPPSVPEPASIATVGVGVIGLIVRRRRSK